jgi:hypothetical protein
MDFMSDRDRFPGTWRLISYGTHFPDGRVEHPFGDEATGLLIYTADGAMSGQVMRAGRAHLPNGYRRSGAVEPVVAAFEGYIAYCGIYQVEEDTLHVVHHVEASLFPNWVGTQQRRGYQFDGERLTLTAPGSRSGVQVSNRLIWQRVA